MSAVSRFKGRLIAAGATGGVLTAVALGVLLPAGAEAATSIQTFTTVPTASFKCISSCNAGGPGPVGNGYTVGRGQIGKWTRTFVAECKLNTEGWAGSRAFRGTVRDVNWRGTWQVYASQVNGANDGNLRWC